MDKAILRARAHQVLGDATIPELPNAYHGKVRDNYDLPDGRRIIIASDRLSAFDRILAAIPFKGQVLTQTARFWFEHTADICPNHVLAYPDPNVVIGKRLDILPVEVVVRGYLAGTTAPRAPANSAAKVLRFMSSSSEQVGVLLDQRLDVLVEAHANVRVQLGVDGDGLHIQLDRVGAPCQGDA